MTLEANTEIVSQRSKADVDPDNLEPVAILVLDVGTSSMKATLWSATGTLLHTTQHEYSPNYLPEDRVEQSPATWEDCLIKLTRLSVTWAAHHHLRIGSLSITAQRSSVIPVDSQGQPLCNAIMWQDKRTASICEEFESEGQFVYDRTGLRISTVFTGPKICWLRQHEPAIYARAHKFLVIPDYLVFLITGKFVTDHTYGSRSLLMNLATRQWDDELLHLFKINADKLCDLVPAGSIVGTSHQMFEISTGLRSGTPVVSAGGDQQCAALGAGVIEEGSLQITTGTGSFVLASSNAARLDPQRRVMCEVSAVPGKYIIESSILSTGAIYKWFNELAYGGGGYDQINADALASPVGSNGVLTLPHFQGRGSPDWNPYAKGAFLNVTLATTKGDLARSILEGVAAEIAENIEIIRETVGRITKITVGGGMTKLDLFNQIQADMYGHEIQLLRNEGTTSLGAFASCAVCAGIYPTYDAALNAANRDQHPLRFAPIAKNVEKYQALKGRLAEAVRRS
jgi:xylulokinase/glycerol kinase